MLMLPAVAKSGPIQTNVIHNGDALAILKCLPSNSIHCLVTSPPFYGLRDYNVDGQLGLEDTPQEYLDRMVAIFREARRVLRSDGVAWVNMGDSYGRGTRTQWDGDSQRGTGVHAKMTQLGNYGNSQAVQANKQLMLMPFALAYALRQDGWWVRSAAPWVKGSAMPESVTDRATTAHEYVFQLAKSERYWFDADAVRMPIKPKDIEHYRKYADMPSKSLKANPDRNDKGGNGTHCGFSSPDMTGRNRRTSDTFYDALDAQIAHWQHVRKHGGPLVGDDTIDALLVNPAGYAAAHFATFPPDLIRPCIRAGCPERVCPVCGRGWVRLVEIERDNYKVFDHPLRTGGAVSGGVGKNFPDTKRIDLGFRPDCACAADSHVPGIVLDPFMGSGTTALVAVQERRRYIGIELNADYIELAKDRFRTGPEKLNAKTGDDLTDLPMFAEVS